MPINLRKVLLLTAVCCFIATCRARAQEPQLPEDPEDDKKLGLWLDQGVSTGLTPNTSLEVEFYERSDENVSNFYEFFAQTGIAFRVRPWLTITPYYRYQRFPGNPTVDYENRLLVNVTIATSRGPWRPNLRTMIEGRFPDGLDPSARIRIRPGLDYTLPLPMKRRPVLVVNDEFFIVPGTNSFAAGGRFTQNRFQAGVRIPITDRVSARPYFLLQSVNLPAGWDTNEIIGLSIAVKLPNKTK